MAYLLNIISKYLWENKIPIEHKIQFYLFYSPFFLKLKILFSIFMFLLDQAHFSFPFSLLFQIHIYQLVPTSHRLPEINQNIIS